MYHFPFWSEPNEPNEPNYKCEHTLKNKQFVDNSSENGLKSPVVSQVSERKKKITGSHRKRKKSLIIKLFIGKGGGI